MFADVDIDDLAEIILYAYDEASRNPDIVTGTLSSFFDVRNIEVSFVRWVNENLQKVNQISRRKFSLSLGRAICRWAPHTHSIVGLGMLLDTAIHYPPAGVQKIIDHIISKGFFITAKDRNIGNIVIKCIQLSVLRATPMESDLFIGRLRNSDLWNDHAATIVFSARMTQSENQPLWLEHAYDLHQSLQKLNFQASSPIILRNELINTLGSAHLVKMIRNAFKFPNCLGLRSQYAEIIAGCLTGSSPLVGFFDNTPSPQKVIPIDIARRRKFYALGRFIVGDIDDDSLSKVAREHGRTPLAETIAEKEFNDNTDGSQNIIRDMITQLYGQLQSIHANGDLYRRNIKVLKTFSGVSGEV